jgi:hypothetical protein
MPIRVLRTQSSFPALANRLACGAGGAGYRDRPLNFQWLSASGPASGEPDPPDDSLAGAGVLTSRSAAIAIAPAGFSVGEFDAWMEGCSAHQPILGGRPYFAILCLPPYSRIRGTVLGTVDSGPAIGGRWLE